MPVANYWWSSGLHLENFQRGGKTSKYEKKRGGRQGHFSMCVNIWFLGGSGGMLPQKMFASETASGAISGTNLILRSTCVHNYSMTQQTLCLLLLLTLGWFLGVTHVIMLVPPPPKMKHWLHVHEWIINSLPWLAITSCLSFFLL